MKKNKICLPFLIGCFLLIGNLIYAQQGCADSTVVIIHVDRDDGILTEDTVIYIYHRDIGSVDEYHSLFDSTFTSSYYSKSETTYYPNGLIEEVLVLSGSPNGWQNTQLTRYSYSPTGKIADQLEFTWNGITWDSLQRQSWEYNSNDSLVNYFLCSRNGASWDSLQRKDWLYDITGNLLSYTDYTRINNQWIIESRIEKTYTNNQLVEISSYTQDTTTGAITNDFKVLLDYYASGTIHSKTYLSNNALTNTLFTDSLYEFTYSGAIRDSVKISYRDTVTGLLQYYDSYNYQFNIGAVCFALVKTTPNTFNSNVDTVTFWIDTMEVLLAKSVFSLQSPSVCTIDYTEWETQNGIYNITFHSYNDYYGETQNDGAWLWIPMDRPAHESYTYDSLGRLVREQYEGGCTNPCGGYFEYNYGPYIEGVPLVIQTMHYETTMRRHHETWTRTHYTRNSISLQSSSSDPQEICGPLFQPNVIMLGGCAPFNYHWEPSFQMDNDSILRPNITVTDSVTYTLYVRDAIGNQDSINYTLYPAINNEIIVLDSTCENRYELQSGQLNASGYQWYRDGVLLQGQDSSIISADTTGNYYVSIMKHIGYDGNQPVYCNITSDTIAVNLHPIIATQTAFICQGTNYILPDGLTANVSGQYRSIIPSSQGCDSTVITDLFVNSIPEIIATSNGIRCYGDSALVMITAQGGTAPYYGIGAFYYTEGTHSLIITDYNGCSDSASIYITSPPPLVADMGNLAIDTCLPFNDNLNISLDAQVGSNGGTSPLNYLWYADGQIVGSVANLIYQTSINRELNLLVTDANGCTASDSGFVSIRNYLSPAIIAVSDTLYSTVIGVGYSWFLNNTSNLLLDTTNFVIPATNGIFYLSVEYSNGCNALSDLFIYNTLNLPGIENLELPLLYPQPANDFVAISWTTEKKRDIKLFSADGRLLKELTTSSLKEILDLKQLASGIYFLWIRQSQGDYKIKVIKE